MEGFHFYNGLDGSPYDSLSAMNFSHTALKSKPSRPALHLPLLDS